MSETETGLPRLVVGRGASPEKGARLAWDYLVLLRGPYMGMEWITAEIGRNFGRYSLDLVAGLLAARWLGDVSRAQVSRVWCPLLAAWLIRAARARAGLAADGGFGMTLERGLAWDLVRRLSPAPAPWRPLRSLDDWGRPWGCDGDLGRVALELVGRGIIDWRLDADTAGFWRVLATPDQVAAALGSPR